jgi:hypothetical protein
MLSKSRILKGKKCVKALWLSRYKREEAVISEAQESIFQAGTDVGTLAQSYFPGGILALEDDYPNAKTVERTLKLINQGVDIIYEATFVFNQVLVAIDILQKTPEGYVIYEVKSTNSTKPEHIQDVAIQYYVLKNLGYPIANVRVMHFDRDYKRQGEIEVFKLFTSDSVLDQMEAYQEEIANRIPELIDILKGEEPEVEMGPQCSKPYGCEFMDYCSGLILADIEEEIANDIDPNELIVYNKDKIVEFLHEIQYPLYSFDFETVMHGVPAYDSSSPYQQIPFQYSLIYKESAESEPIYYDFIGDGLNDPRESLIQKMIADFQHGHHALCYNVGFERSRINELILDFPQYTDELTRIQDQLVDLLPLFRNHYRTNKTAHSASLKTVLPAYVEGMSYDDLEISHGMETSQQYAELAHITDAVLREKVLENMLIYCRQDTLGVLKLYDFLWKEVMER